MVDCISNSWKMQWLLKSVLFETLRNRLYNSVWYRFSFFFYRKYFYEIWAVASKCTTYLPNEHMELRLYWIVTRWLWTKVAARELFIIIGDDKIKSRWIGHKLGLAKHQNGMDDVDFGIDANRKLVLFCFDQSSLRNGNSYTFALNHTHISVLQSNDIIFYEVW